MHEMTPEEPEQEQTTNAHTYQVSLSNTFEADSPQDAVAQFVVWAIDNAHRTMHRVTNVDTDESWLIDAEDVL